MVCFSNKRYFKIGKKDMSHVPILFRKCSECMHINEREKLRVFLIHYLQVVSVKPTMTVLKSVMDLEDVGLYFFD